MVYMHSSSISIGAASCRRLSCEVSRALRVQVGGVLRVVLHGRCQRQLADHQYYIAIRCSAPPPPPPPTRLFQGATLTHACTHNRSQAPVGSWLHRQTPEKQCEKQGGTQVQQRQQRYPGQLVCCQLSASGTASPSAAVWLSCLLIACESRFAFENPLPRDKRPACSDVHCAKKEPDQDSYASL